MDPKNSSLQAVAATTAQLPVGDAPVLLEDFRIGHPKEIVSVLRQLMSAKDFLTVEASNCPRPIVTRILEVDQKAGLFIYDGRVEEMDRRFLLESDENYFSAAQGGIRIQFVSGRPEQFEFEGASAFRAALPESLYRIQRREFFRAAAPLVESYCCTAKLPDRRQLVFDVFDLSLNGVGLRSKDPAVAMLPTGTVLSKTVLDCRKMGVIESDLKITNMHTIQGRHDLICHIGCRFEHFPKSKEQDLQRMVTYLELARRGR